MKDLFGNNLNYINFPIDLFSFIENRLFRHILVEAGIELGCTYRFMVTDLSGNPLTKDGLVFDSIKYSLPSKQSDELFDAVYEFHTMNSMFWELDDDFAPVWESFIALSDADIITNDAWGDVIISPLQKELEAMVEESDFLIEILKARDITRGDIYEDMSLNSKLELNLTYFKTNV